MKNSTTREVEKLEAAMEVNPPVIEWVLHPVRRVLVAARIYDPHPDQGWQIPKTVCVAGHRYTEENTITRTDGSRECRECKRRRSREHFKKKTAETPRETTLLTAARTQI